MPADDFTDPPAVHTFSHLSASLVLSRKIQVFLELENITSLVAETPHGWFGMLPQCLDCVAPLGPGILTCIGTAGEAFIAGHFSRSAPSGALPEVRKG